MASYVRRVYAVLHAQHNDHKVLIGLGAAVVALVAAIVFVPGLIGWALSGSSGSSGPSIDESRAAPSSSFDKDDTGHLYARPADPMESMRQQILVSEQPRAIDDDKLREAILANRRAERQAALTLRVGDLSLTAPPGYSLFPESPITSDDSVEYDGRQSDVGEHQGREFWPRVRLAAEGFGVSNLRGGDVDLSECRKVAGVDESRQNILLGSEPVWIGYTVYQCENTRFIHWWSSTAYGSRNPLTIEYFAQSERVPEEFEHMIGSATLVEP